MSHPEPVLPGVHIATGPMGQGIGAAQGFAIAGRTSPRFDSYCMVGDGERHGTKASTWYRPRPSQCGFAQQMARWLGAEANLEFVPWEQWRATVSEQDGRGTLDHISHSPNCSIAKARTLLGYAPRFSSLQAVKESVRWIQEHAVI